MSNKKQGAEEKLEEQLERSQYIYEQVKGWIENADNKVSISCAVFTGVFGVITFLSERITERGMVTNGDWRIAYYFFLVSSIVAMIIAVICYTMAIYPNLGKSGKNKEKVKGQKDQKKYPLFFGDISEMSNDGYHKAMKNGSTDDYLNELLDEIHYNSKICIKKMNRYRIGLQISLVAIILSVFALVARCLAYV